MKRGTILRKDSWVQLNHIMENATGLSPIHLEMSLKEWGPPHFPCNHGLYYHPISTRHWNDARLVASGLDPEELTWLHDPKDPPFWFDPDDPEVVVAIYDTLDTPEQTFEHLWSWMVDEQPNAQRWSGFSSHISQLRDIRDPTHANWQPRTRRWVKVKLDAHRGKSPHWVRQNVDPEQIAGLEAMAALAHQRFALRTRDGHTKPWINMTSLEFNQVPLERSGDKNPLKHEAKWLGVPTIDFFVGNDEVRLDANFVRWPQTFRSSPVLLSE